MTFFYSPLNPQPIPFASFASRFLFMTYECTVWFDSWCATFFLLSSLTSSICFLLSVAARTRINRDPKLLPSNSFVALCNNLPSAALVNLPPGLLENNPVVIHKPFSEFQKLSKLGSGSPAQLDFRLPQAASRSCTASSQIQWSLS